MKKLLLICAFVMGISAVSFAQQGGRSPSDMTDRLKTQLTGLTADQTTKITAIYTVRAKSMDSLMTVAQNGGDRAAMMPAFMKISAATDAKIKAVLTPDQAAAYQKIADANAERMKSRMQGGN